jgi:hypothetical protein
MDEIYEITKNLDLGSIISVEDYELLSKYNKELDKYFLLTGDGYKLISGNGNKVYNEVVGAQFE